MVIFKQYDSTEKQFYFSLFGFAENQKQILFKIKNAVLRREMKTVKQIEEDSFNLFLFVEKRSE